MATMVDIAKKAGVSLSTVSYVLSGDRPISEATKARVHKAMAELNYTPNVLARGLASKKSRIIALLGSDTGHGFGSTEMAIVQATSLSARQRGYHLVFWTDDDAEGLEALSGQGLVDGILLMEVRINDPRLSILRNTSLPLACIGRAHEDTKQAEVPWVDIDYQKTLDLALVELYKLGHRNIVLLNQSQEAKALGYGPAVRVSTAYQEAMTLRGLTARELCIPSSSKGGCDAVEELFTNNNVPTALLVMNDRAIPGILKGLALHGLRVPFDVSILSLLSSAAMAEQSVPALSSLEIPSTSLGRQGVDALLDLIESSNAGIRNAKLREVTLACNLVIRESTSNK